MYINNITTLEAIMFFLAIFLIIAGYAMHSYIYAISGTRSNLMSGSKAIPFLIFTLVCFILSRQVFKDAYYASIEIADKVRMLPWQNFINKVFFLLFG